MASMTPMALWGMEVPCGDLAISGRPDIPSAFRITMAAIDPSAEPEGEKGAAQRATLKVIRQPLELDDYSDEDDDDDEGDFDTEMMERILAAEAEEDDDDEDEEVDDEDEDEDDDDEDVNGEGPSDPAKNKKAQRAAAQKEIEALLKNDDMEMDGDKKPNGVNGVSKSAKSKGKQPLEVDEDEDDDDDEDDDLDMEGEMEEFVMCTLDPKSHYQQPLDITIGEDERVWFKVTGTHSIFLTGNYVEPATVERPGLYDPDDDEEGDYDLEPDMDELDDEEDEEEDELDDIADPRIMDMDEMDDEDEIPKLLEIQTATQKKKADKKSDSKKRPAPESDDADAEEGANGLDDLISKSIKAEAPAAEEPKLSKKQLKKLKKNDGTAAKVADLKKEAEAPSSNKSDKKVSFAKDLEQGPTPTKATAAADTATAKPKASLGVKVVQGVTIDDKTLGTGPAAKAGDRVGMRYIGKLQKDNKIFDSNKKGKPFSFKLGAGEVIKGWDIGVAGMSVGAERRITIPAHLGYGKSGAPPQIPGNATLVFDIKMLEIGGGKK